MRLAASRAGRACRRRARSRSGMAYGCPSTANATWQTKPSSRIAVHGRRGRRRRAPGSAGARCASVTGISRREWWSPWIDDATGMSGWMNSATSCYICQSTLRTPITVDRRRPAPLHRQIYDEWRRGILAGRFPPRGADAVDARARRGAARVARHRHRRLRPARGRRISGRAARLRDLRVAGPAGRRARGRPKPRGRARRRSSAAAVRLRRPAGADPGAGAAARGRHQPLWDGPRLDQFPFAVWTRLVRRHLRRTSPGLFRYGADGAGVRSAARGDRRLLAPVARGAVPPGTGGDRAAARSRRWTCAAAC